MEELIKKMKFAKKGIDKIMSTHNGFEAWDVALSSKGYFYVTLWNGEKTHGIQSDTIEGLVEKVKEWSGKCQ